jgi:hypothetical protein
MSDTHFDTATASLRNAAQKGEMAARQMKDDANDAIPAFIDAVRAIADALRVAGRKASVVMSELGEEAQDTGVKTRDYVIKKARTRPVRSGAALVSAAVIGLLAGLFLSRR